MHGAARPAARRCRGTARRGSRARTTARSRDLRDEIGPGVDVAECGGLEQAAGVDVVLAHEVGDGPSDLDEAIDASRGERAAVLDEIGEGALAHAVEPAGRAQ